MSPLFFILLLSTFSINVCANPLKKHLNQPDFLKIHGKPVKVDSSVPITWKTFGDTSIEYGIVEEGGDGSEYEARVVEGDSSQHATLNFIPVVLSESTNLTTQQAAQNNSYLDEFARSTMLYLAAAAYNAKPEVCLNRTLSNVVLNKNVNISCDVYGKDDICAGFTALSHTDNAIIVAFRGTSAFIQLMVETSTTIMEEQVVSPIGGKVGSYFANVFERLWFNNSMGQDFKTLHNLYPNYDLWVSRKQSAVTLEKKKEIIEAAEKNKTKLAEQFEIPQTTLNDILKDKKAILKAIAKRNIAKRTGFTPGMHVKLTGHSLGGALASLAAAQIVADAQFNVSKIKLYTFGQPRTGDSTFADALDVQLPTHNTYRITHSRDPVPHMPPHSYNYTHNKAEVFYFNNMTPNKTYTLCEDEQESQNCSAKIKYVFSVLDHLFYFNINVSNFGKTGCKSSKKQKSK